MICKALKGQLFLIRSKEDDGTKFQLIIQAKISGIINMIDDKEVKKLKEMDIMLSVMSSLPQDNKNPTVKKETKTIEEVPGEEDE